MAMPPQERSNPLHNFNLPCFKWGSRRFLRCVKVTDGDVANRSSSSFPNGLQSGPMNVDPSKNQKPNSFQQNLTSPDRGLNGFSKRLKVSPLIEEERGNDDPSRPWNLRTRRAACRAPLRIEERKNVVDSSIRRNNLEIDSPRRNESLLVPRPCSETMKEKVKFSVSLAKEEIEEDFLEMVRIRPPRRPKKRPRIVQKYLDTIFPGLWLGEVTPDSYKVPELPES